MKQAAVMKVEASSVGADELAAKVVEYLRAQQLQRIMLPTSPLLEQLGIPEALRSAGGDVGTWEQMTLDQAYDFDCGVTDAAYAVAETGSIVIKPHRGHGRAVSLVPTHHVVILEPANFVPDLVDLFERLGREGLSGSGCVLITGPSKTADIEMNLVEGVHGPRAVRAFVLA
jgi:L-lactate utilization protein LutC